MKNQDWMKPNADVAQRFMDEVYDILTKGAIEDWPMKGPPKLVPIHDLPADEKARYVVDIAYSRWKREYRFEGLSMELGDRILNNALQGRPKEEWLKPTAHEMERERGGRGGR